LLFQGQTANIRYGVRYSHITLPQGCQLTCYDDDVALTVVGKHLNAVENTCSVAVQVISNWLLTVGLELAANKTEAVLVSTRAVVEIAHIRVGAQIISSKRAIRYLGVMIDTRLCFREHLSYVQEKAANTSRSLFRIMLNTRGARQERRILLTSVVCSVAIWAEGIQKISHARGVKSIPPMCVENMQWFSHYFGGGSTNISRSNFNRTSGG